MLLFFRSVLFAVGYGVATIVYGTMGVLLALILPAKWGHSLLISWCKVVIVWLRITCGVRYRIIGLDNFQKTPGPKVVLSKHQSAWETLMLQSVFRPTSTILKKELLSIPFFGWGLRRLQPIAIDRSNPRQALREVKAQGLDRLARGLNLLLFPEGTRVAPGTRGKYARSGPDIAVAAEVDVIPVALNAGHCWPPKSFIKRPGLITVVVGEPISTQNKTSRMVIEEVEAWIEGELEVIEGRAASPSAAA